MTGVPPRLLDYINQISNHDESTEEEVLLLKQIAEPIDNLVTDNLPKIRSVDLLMLISSYVEKLDFYIDDILQQNTPSDEPQLRKNRTTKKRDSLSKDSKKRKKKKRKKNSLTAGDEPLEPLNLSFSTNEIIRHNKQSNDILSPKTPKTPNNTSMKHEELSETGTRPTRSRSRSVEDDFRSPQTTSTESLPVIEKLTASGNGKDHRKEFLFKKASTTMALSDIFAYGFLIAESMNKIMYTEVEELPIHSKNQDVSAGEKVRAKLTRKSLHFRKTKKVSEKPSTYAVITQQNEIVNELIVYFEKFLNLAGAFRPKMAENDIDTTATTVTASNESSGDVICIWRVIFYQYIQDMFSTTGTQYETKIKYILTQQKIETMKNCLTHYLTENSHTQKKYKITASELLDYFSSCKEDPYSCLIGHAPARRVITQILHEKLSNPMECNATPGSLVVAKLKKSTSTPLHTSTTNTELPQTPTSKASINDSSTNNFYYVYGRVLYKINKQIQIATSVYSCNKPVTIDGKDCYSLPPSLLEEISRDSEWNIHGLDKFIENPIDELARKLMFVDTEKVIRGYLAMQGINLSVLFHAVDQRVTLADVYELHRGNTVCRSIMEKIPEDLKEETKEIIHKKIEDFFKCTPKEKLFMPTLAKRRQELYDVYIQAILAISRQIAGNCSGCLDQLKLNRRDLLSGKTKNELVEWWLSEIENSMNELLNSFGFHFDALPENYILEPPSNFKLVTENLSILDSINSSSKLNVYIENLKNKIYPQIESFLINSKAVLSAQLALDLRSFHDVNKLCELFKEKEDELRKDDASLADWIEDAIEDIRYLTEMKKLEDPEYAATNSNPHIVSVTGLCYAVFARLTNELKTATELWEHLQDDFSNQHDVDNLANNNEPIVQSKQIRDALDAKNFELAEILLDRVISTNSFEKYFDVNEKHGKNEFTILHSAIYHSQFKLAQKILRIKSLKLNVPDKNRNFPIHFCYAVPSSIQSDQVKFFKKILSSSTAVSSSNPVNFTNIVGETPLHTASFHGRFKICKLFVENNANVNILTKNSNESCLHYAVRSGVPRVIRVLLDAKADPVLRSSNGETPLDIAIRLQSNAIIAALQNAYTS